MDSATLTAAPPGAAARGALRFFNLYRVTLSGLFVLLVWNRNLPPPLGGYDGALFASTASLHFVLACLAQILVETRPAYYTAHVLGQVLLDIGAITVYMYASGGVGSGVGMLLAVSIALGALLTAGRTALFFAGVATSAVLLEEVFLWASAPIPMANYTHAGLLGTAFFTTALLGHVLAERLRASEALAAQRGADIEGLERLSERIVQRMRSGVLVIDAADRVRLANDAAIALLGREGPLPASPLSVLAPELSLHLANRQRRGPAAQLLRTGNRTTDLLISAADLGRGALLVFIEDAAAIHQRAQRLKLGSLGRLAAGIAHEIRNPLSAISHAAQLLSESAARAEEDARLTRIIQGHSARVNRIVENVLAIGRREPSLPEAVAMGPWLSAFVTELKERMGLAQDSITVAVEPADMEAVMDRSQLHQVLWNLCENGLRVSRGTPALEFHAGIKPLAETPYLDIIDHGPGIPAEIAEAIFEPFVSGRPGGTGLGLYIAAELCECNQATLSLHANSPSGCCFRISFPHPQRQQWSA